MSEKSSSREEDILPFTKEQREYLERGSKIDFDNQQRVKDYTQTEINKIIFYLSTGTFVLSISFIGYFQNGLILPYLLILSWACFSLAIAGQVTVHSLSKRVADKKQTHINKSRETNFGFSWQIETRRDKEIMKWSKLAKKVDVAIIALLMAGILSLLIFAAANLLYKNRETKINEIRRSHTLRPAPYIPRTPQ